LNILDIIIFVVVVAGFILGYKDGFVRKVIGLIGFGLAVFLAIKFSDLSGRYIENLFGIEFYLSEIIGGILIFLLIIFATSVLKRIVHPFDKINNLLNQIIGGVVGIIQILYFLSAVLFLLNIFNFPSQKVTDSSLFYKPVYSIIPATIEIIKNYTPETKKIIKEYINDKDSVK